VLSDSAIPASVRRFRGDGFVVTSLCAWVSACLLLLSAGCAHVPNQFREDGPSVNAELDTPTARDVFAAAQPAEPRRRPWPALAVAPESGAVKHWPSYFEDPFVDKGHGRTDASHPGNVYRLGWEDYLAFPYCFARYTLNWLAFPVSAVVTPPWTLMESDGKLSRQALGYDHDAAPVPRAAASPATEAEETPEPPATQVPAEAEGDQAA